MAFGEIIDDSLALITTSTRSIGFIVPDCTISERHSDRLEITRHPVEIGAATTDHSFRQPSTVLMEIGFSNSTAGSYGWDQVAYQELLDLQRSRQPFDVSTGKKAYSNMLIGEILVSNTQETEYALMATVELSEIIITSTSQSGGVPQSAQASPEQTTSPQTNGFQQAPAAGGLPSFGQAQTSAGASASGDLTAG